MRRDLGLIPAAGRVRVRLGASRNRRVVSRVGARVGPRLLDAEAPLQADVVVHFAEPPDRLYQLDQWLPVFERLAEHRTVLLLLRDRRTLRSVAARTTLPLVCVPSFLGLVRLFEHSDLKVGIYLNNSDRNFQSLSNPRMLHVHVGHGDSDKLSSASNQVKAYDRVFVAGPLAARRYSDVLMDFDDSRLVVVGRPQLDLSFVAGLPASNRRTVLYAPTWQGATEANNWTSVDCFGPQIVRAALDITDVRLIYKPHPRIASSSAVGVRRGHQSIIGQIEQARTTDSSAGHRVVGSGNVLAMLGQCDLLVSDVGSVSLDYLYLRPDGPVVLTDRRSDREAFLQATPLARAADVVDSTTLGAVRDLFAARLKDDVHQAERARLRDDYFGALARGESLVRFADEVGRLVDLRDELITSRSRSRRA